ncbi:hypothetical protein [Robertmurraya korlensis]|uniref:hypothetical protein n=1 Tax=Robertmurraya korlensis TaxID=519977 RepID=UPI0008265AC1|nr:hypothetical protein [Robertmurraya korlensis]
MNREEMFDKRLLIRDILNTLWVIIGLYLIGTGTELFLTSYDRGLFFLEVIFFPLIKFLAVMLATEIYMKKNRKYMEYIVMIAITLIVAIIVISLYMKITLMILLVFPVIVSLFFYNKKLVQFSIYISILTLSFIYLFYWPVRTQIDTSDLIIIIVIIVGVSLLIYKLMKHSLQIMNHLLLTTKAKNDLFSRNIQMERLTRIDPVTELYNHRSFHEHLVQL